MSEENEERVSRVSKKPFHFHGSQIGSISAYSNGTAKVKLYKTKLIKEVVIPALSPTLVEQGFIQDSDDPYIFKYTPPNDTEGDTNG